MAVTMEIGPTSIKSISFTNENNTYGITLIDSSLHYYKNGELISVKEVPVTYNSKNLYETVKKITDKLGIKESELILK